MLEVPDLELLAAVAEVDHIAGRARRRNCRHFVERELALGEDIQDLAPDIACRPDDRDTVSHCCSLSWAWLKWLAKWARARRLSTRPDLSHSLGLRGGKPMTVDRDSWRRLITLALLLAAFALKSALIAPP